MPSETEPPNAGQLGQAPASSLFAQRLHWHDSQELGHCVGTEPVEVFFSTLMENDIHPPFSFSRCRALEEGGPGLLAGVGVQVGQKCLINQFDINFHI